MEFGNENSFQKFLSKPSFTFTVFKTWGVVMIEAQCDILILYYMIHYTILLT